MIFRRICEFLSCHRKGEGEEKAMKNTPQGRFNIFFVRKFSIDFSQPWYEYKDMGRGDFSDPKRELEMDFENFRGACETSLVYVEIRKKSISYYKYFTPFVFFQIF